MRPARVGAVLALYTVVVVGLTWPLAAHLATHLPRTKFICDFDLRQMIWALAWQTHALVSAPARFYDANVYHPTPHALLYADAGFGALPYFAPTFLATGNPVLASNLLFAGGITLTVCGMHLLVAHWTGLESAGLVAAGTLLVTPWVLWTWIPAAPNYAVLWMVPAIILVAARPEPSRATLVALLVLEGAANPYYAAATLTAVGAIGAGRRSPRLLVAVVVAALVLGALYAPYAWLRVHDPGLADRLTWKTERFLARAVPMKVPADLLADPKKPTAVPVPLLVLVGLGAVLRFVPRAARRDGERTAWRHGLAWTATGLALCLMPTIEVLGYAIHLPGVAALDALPLVQSLREPFRIGVGALFGIAVLAGVAFSECAQALRAGPVWRGIAAVTILMLAAGVWRAPHEDGSFAGLGTYPLSAAAVPQGTIATVLGDEGGPVLVLPVTGSFIEQLAGNAQAMFESIGHWQPLVNGYGGFYPASFTGHMRLAARLPNVNALAELRRATDLRWVYVRAGAMLPATATVWSNLAHRGGGDGLRLVARDGADLLFAVSGDAR